ncbi:hypothetical protein AB4Z39_16825 [Mycobacterium adipatum]|uniref:hypothetical protein n=1 Tax=Mycobacterium adipatum TaxID=1682113 RepID=UPI0034E07EB7
MIDMFSHFAVLDVLHARLQSDALADDADDAIREAYKALEDYHAYAVLGSVVDHLIAHDTVSDVELSVLTRALTTFKLVKELIGDLRDVRERFEQLVLNPSAPGALSRYNRARVDLADILIRFDTVAAEVHVFVWQWLKPLKYLVPHPQNDDAPVTDWPWRDTLLSRRTGAFAAATMDLARQSGRPEALAFGVGVLASYIGNAIGSPYLTRSVGGPRRSHRLRDRLAAYSTGAWLHHFGPVAGLAPAVPTTVLPTLGSPNQALLPNWLVALINGALTDTYGGVAPLPDIVVAYRNLRYHWHLLHSFQPVAPPKPVTDDIAVPIANNLGPKDYWSGPEPTGPQNFGPAPANQGSFFDPGPGNPPWLFSKYNTVVDWIWAILDILMGWPRTTIRFVYWLGHGGKVNPTNQAQTVAALKTPETQNEYDSAITSKDFLIAIKAMHDKDLQLFSLAEHFLWSLKVGGLLYPTAKDLPTDTFSQFVVPPTAPPGFQWPARQLADPTEALKFPSTAPAENNPTATEFADGEKPIAFLTGSTTAAPYVARHGYIMFRDELHQAPAAAIRTTNVNLDADRGPGGSCWNLAAGTSMHDDPVNVIDLAYNDL